jgi:3'-phosphoadenosine 5'-phosphosulfate sulfotransferase (PAPS reductase)/FAD synthetase
MSITYEVMKQRKALPLEAKIVFTQKKIREWYEHWRGDVYVSFSGGKDSTVLLDIVKDMYPDVPAVFCDTGLEYPEVRELALKKADVVLKPSMNFKQVLEVHGYPVVGKKQARMIRDLQNKSGRNEATRRLRLTGIKKDGTISKMGKLADKWQFLGDAPFKVSEKCCDVMKKEPFHRYQEETGRYGMNATMAAESESRAISYMKTGCNAFDNKTPLSTPMAVWTEDDVLQYIEDRGLEYASCYGEIVKTVDGWITTREHRTGCMFCMFGIQFDGVPNRFQRIQRDYPKQYDYCINKLGIGAVLDYVGIPYAYQPTLFDQLEVNA